MNGRVLEHSELTKEHQPDSAWDKVQTIPVPVQLYCGDLDFPYMREIGQTLADRIPQGRAYNLPGMAHMPFLEDPELMNEQIRRFLGCCSS